MWPATETRALPGDDMTTGLGLGVGELGAGPLGYDGAAWRWKRNDLASGPHTVRIDALDQQIQELLNERARCAQQVAQANTARAARDRS